MIAENVTVLHSMPAPTGPTRFSTQMRDGAPPELHVKFFSWNDALRGEYDVFHAHWPEYLLRGGSRLGRWRKQLRFMRLLRRLRKSGIPVVRTLHNLDPHESGSRMEKMLLNRLLEQTDAFVRLNPVTVPPRDKKIVTILHGHYRDQFQAYAKHLPVAGRVLNFGLIRPYKNVPALIDAFDAIGAPGRSLRIVGKPADEFVRRQVEELVASTANVSAELSFVDDQKLVSEVTSAEVVVLPYAEMHNSGTLLVSLSLSRPVILPRSDSNEAIAHEVGPGWVFMYEGRFSAESLEEGLAWLSRRGTVGADPDLASRDWSYVGAQHLDLYRTLLSESPAK